MKNSPKDNLLAIPCESNISCYIFSANLAYALILFDPNLTIPRGGDTSPVAETTQAHKYLHRIFTEVFKGAKWVEFNQGHFARCQNASEHKKMLQ